MQTQSATARIKITAKPTPQKDLQEAIRQRAYELYEERGRDDGHDVEDWLQAEAEMLGRSSTAA